MKNRVQYLLFSLVVSTLATTPVFSQAQSEFGYDMSDVRMHLQFLSSDELQGRKTGELGNHVAARYISEQFRRIGLATASGMEDYFQKISFEKIKPPKGGSFIAEFGSYNVGQDFLVLDGTEKESSVDIIFANYAWPGDPKVDLDEIDVAGKWVLAHIGTPDNQDVQASLTDYSHQKREALKEAGAKGLIEIYQGRIPWQLLKRFLNREQIQVAFNDDDDSDFLYALVDGTSHEELRTLEQGPSSGAALSHDGRGVENIQSSNIIGLLPGTDPILKNEYIVLSAHYDHVGAGVQENNPKTLQDSIFNGARDNAFGVTALLTTAQSLAMEPLRRSVIFIAFTAEEDGLLGSEYYVQNPVIPLDKTIFNLNTDGAGYSDTSIISVFGLQRLGIEEHITKACASVGLGVFGDPAPEQNLFDRSDNVSFAKVGIPAPTISPGFKEFDQVIMEHYHQPSDEAASLDFDYLLRFCQAYSLIARSIGDRSRRPRWTEGDKYEEAFNSLYGDLPDVPEMEPEEKVKKERKKKKRERKKRASRSMP
ncbi:MAG: M28 family peptidase [Saprospiraceae bacterium]|nr:M28 family peptidase [Saprospiraceae bacterium]